MNLLSRKFGAAAALALALLLHTGQARAEPQAVLAAPTLAGAQATAAVAVGSGLGQVLLVADAASNQLRFFALVSLQEIGTPASLLAGCAPRDLLVVGVELYVACSGADALDVFDLSGFSLETPTLPRLAARPGGVAVGSGPARLLQVQNGPDSFLVVMNETGKTASVVTLSGGNAPIGVNADDSSEAADPLTAPVPVRVCGEDAAAANRSVPVGLGVGTQRFYVACDDGILSYFDPFAGGDFSLGVTLDLGLVALVDAAGIAGTNRFFLQTQTDEFAAMDLSNAESGGSVAPQVLYNDGTAHIYAAGPVGARGLVPFFDSQDGTLWLALLGDAAGAEVRLFNVDDLDDVAYTPPAVRAADQSFTTGLAAFSGAGAVRAHFREGNLYVPSGGAAASIITAGPIFTFTSPGAPLAISSLADPTLGTCTPVPDITVAWTSTESVDEPSFDAVLVKSTDPSYPLSFDASGGMAGDVTVSLADVADLAGGSEETLVRIIGDDADGNAGVAQEIVLVDGTRPSLPANVGGQIVQGILYLSWTVAADAGGLLASGVTNYFVQVYDEGGTPIGVPVSTPLPSLNYDLMGAIGPGEGVQVTVAACDAAGNRSTTFTAPVVIGQGVLGGAGAFGETGGCVLTQDVVPHWGIPLLVLFALALLARRSRRRSAS